MDIVSKSQRLDNPYQRENDWSGFIRENNLRSIEEIPENYRHVFSNFTHFNKIQSKVFDDVYYTDNPVVISSPTGSGKTVIFELAIVRFLINLELINKPNAYRMVYISPLKALCDERLLDWHNKFKSLGVNCISVTGDNENYDLYNLNNFVLIITTPEKWDSLTRKWRNNKSLMQSIKLFMIDEVHLLNEDSRGSTLEAVLNRMKIIEENLKYQPSERNVNLFRNTRYMAVSATIPNVEDVAEWLGNSLIPAKCFKFGEEMRPVPLKRLVLGYSQQTNNFKFDLAMNYRLQSIILQHSMGKPTLIFCNTRKSVEMTAKHLLQNLTVHLTQDQKSRIQESLSSVINQSLKEFLINGIGCHHAGLPFDTRRIIENLFRTGNLGVLVTTSTLALGVNLPAHLVIIKTTKYYSGGEYKDYSESMILQMIGRAGRPQFDQSGTAVILTTITDKKKYETLVEGHQAIESNLHKHLIEHLNAEVVLKTITDLSVAMQWITSTFLYVRARKNPRHYGLPLGLNTDQIDRKLLDMCQIEINKLAKTGLLTIDQNDIVISPTLSGSLMAKYYIAFETMKLFTTMSGKEALQQVLGIISKCNEFSDIHLRNDEKKTLNMINKNKEESIRFPLSGRITSSDMKVNCIIQAVFGGLPISDYSLNNESQKIMRIGERLSKCLAEYLETKVNGYSALLSSLTLAKCFHAQLWEKSKFVSRQLPGIGNVLSCQLVNAGKTTFQSILDSNPRDLERIMNRKPPFGNTIQDKVKFLPVYELSLTKQENNNAILLTVIITLKNVEDLKINSTVNGNSFMNLLVGEKNENIIYLYEKYVHSSFLNEPCIQKQILIPISDDVEILSAHFISEDWVGIDKEETIDLKQNKEKNDFFPKKKIPTATSINKLSNKKPEASQKKGAKKVQTVMDKFFKNSKNVTQNKKSFTQKTESQTSKTSPDTIPIKNEIVLSQTKNNSLNNEKTTTNNDNETPLSKNHQENISSVNASEELKKETNKLQDTQNFDISPGSLRRSMEQYVRDNFNYYDQLLNKYGGSTPQQDKNDNLETYASDTSNGNDQNTSINNFGTKANKLLQSQKPSLVKKLSNIMLGEKNTNDIKDSNENVFEQGPSSKPPSQINKVSNNYPKQGPSIYPSRMQNTPSSITPSLIPPQNMTFFSISLSPKVSTSRRYPMPRKRNTQKIINPVRKHGLNISNFDFEDSLMAPGPLSQNDCLLEIVKSCTKQPEDKLTHSSNRSIKNEEKPIRLSTNENNYFPEDRKLNNNLPENLKTDVKSISWRSPLISSPQQKYSPNVSRDLCISDLPTYNPTIIENVQEDSLDDDMRDFLSSSLLETIEKLHEQQSNIKSHYKEPSTATNNNLQQNQFEELQHPEKKIKISESCATVHQKFNEDQLEQSTRMSSSSMLNNTADIIFRSEQISSRESENNCSFTENILLENRGRQYDRYYSDRNHNNFQEENFESRNQSISQYNNPRKTESSFPFYETRSQQQDYPKRNFHDDFSRPYTQHHYPLRDVNFIGQPYRPSPCCCRHNDFPHDRFLRRMDYYYDSEPEKIDTTLKKKNIQPNGERYRQEGNFGGPYDKENEFQMKNRNPRSEFLPHRFIPSDNNKEVEFFDYTYQRNRVPSRNNFEQVLKPGERHNIDHHQAYERENFVGHRFSPSFGHSHSSRDCYQDPRFQGEDNYQRRFMPIPREAPSAEENTQHNFSLLHSNGNSPLQVPYSQHLESPHLRRLP